MNAVPLIPGSKKSGNKAAYHEAFHAVFRTIFTPLQVKNLLEKAKAKYAKPSKSQLDYLQANAILNGKHLSPQERVDLYYEEKLADDFMQFGVRVVFGAGIGPADDSHRQGGPRGRTLGGEHSW